MLSESPTEITTAATDLVLAVECAYFAGRFCRQAGSRRFRSLLWASVFALTALAALLGTLAHGIQWSPLWLNRIWMALYFCLGLVVALFLVGAVGDLRGQAGARRLLPFAIALGTVFFGATQIYEGGFTVFVVYEGLVMSVALAIYLWLAMARAMTGAKLIASAIALNLVAAGVQATDLSVKLMVEFDHNGLFHLLQMIAIALLGAGLERGSLARLRRTGVAAG